MHACMVCGLGLFYALWNFISEDIKEIQSTLNNFNDNHFFNHFFFLLFFSLLGRISWIHVYRCDYSFLLTINLPQPSFIWDWDRLCTKLIFCTQAKLISSISWDCKMVYLAQRAEIKTWKINNFIKCERDAIIKEMSGTG